MLVRDKEKKEDRSPTYKVELVGKDCEEGLTVQSKHDGEIGAQRAPHKHMVDDGPEACVESNLHNHTQTNTQNTRGAHLICMTEQYLKCREYLVNATLASLTCTLTTITRAVAVVTAKVW